MFHNKLFKFSPIVLAMFMMACSEDGSVTQTEDPGPQPAQAGQTVSFVPSEAAEGSVLTIITEPDKGSLIVNEQGSLTFDPSDDFDFLAKAQQQEISFTFSDGTNTYTSYIKVTGVNDKPVVTSSSVVGELTSSNSGSLIIQGQLTVSDPDEGDSHVFAVKNQPDSSLGSVEIDANGGFTFTAADTFPDLAEGDVQELSFTYTASDAYISSDPAKVTLTVTGGDFGDNHRPEVADILPVLVGIGNTVTIPVEMSDADGDELEIKLLEEPQKGQLTLNQDNSFTYDPGTDFADLPFGQTEELSFSFKVEDSSGKANAASELKTVSITVSGVSDTENNQPIVDIIELNVTADAGSSVEGQFSVKDLDPNDLHTYQLESEPALGQVTKSGNKFIYEPGNDFALLAKGSTQKVVFTYTATDDANKANSTSLPAAIVVTVTGVNEDAKANNQPQGVSEQYSLNLDGSTLTKQLGVSDDDLADSHSFEIVSAPEKGSLVNNNDGSFTFSPGSDFNNIESGKSQFVSFSYTVKDDSGAANELSPESLITIELVSINNQPTVVDLSMEASVATGPVSIELSADDIDTSDVHSFLIVEGYENYENNVSISGNQLTFDPKDDFKSVAKDETRSVTFSYAADDGSNAANSQSLAAEIIVTVTGVNDAPLAENNSHSTKQGGDPVDGRFILKDPDLSDSLDFEVIKKPDEGLLSEQGSNYIFDPQDDFKWLAAGDTVDVKVEYLVIDEHGLESEEPGVITITIEGINDAPEAAADAYGVNEGESLTVSAADGVLKNDSDIDQGDVLTAELLTSVEHGTLTLNPDGSFTYVHDGSETVSDSFTYKALDASLESEIVTVSIDVSPVQDVVSTTENSPISDASVLSDVEEPPTGVVYELVSGIDVGRLVFNSDGSFDFDPAGNFNDLKAGETQTLVFTYQIRDIDTGATESHDVNINVVGEADIDFELSSTKITRAEHDVSYDISAHSGLDISISIDIANDPRARYRNSFGYYFANADGEPISGEVMMVNSYDSSGVSGAGKAFASIVRNEDIPVGAVSVGFFLVPNGGQNEGAYYIDADDSSKNDDTVYNPENSVANAYEDGAKVSFENVAGVWVASTSTGHQITAIGPSHGALREGCSSSSLSSSDHQLIFSDPALNYNAGIASNYPQVQIAGSFNSWTAQDMIFDGCNAWTKVISAAGDDEFKFIVDSKWYGASSYSEASLVLGAPDITLPSGAAYYDLTVYDDGLWLVTDVSEIEPLDASVSERVSDQEGKDVRASATSDDFIFGDMPGIDDVDDLYLTYNILAGNNFASNEDEYITGGIADDLIDARGGNDILITGKGSDLMTGGSDYVDNNGLAQDDDLFIWLAGDYGTEAEPDEDKILDFGVSGGNDDTLDLSALVSTCSSPLSCIEVSIVEDSIASGGGIKEGDTFITISPATDAKVIITLQNWGAADWLAAYPDAGWTNVDAVVAQPELLLSALIASQNLYVIPRK